MLIRGHTESLQIRVNKDVDWFKDYPEEIYIN
jgi:hypothetical protein